MTLLSILAIIILTVLGTLLVKSIIDYKLIKISKADLARYNTTVENYDELLAEKIILETLLWQVQQKKALGEVVE